MFTNLPYLCEGEILDVIDSPGKSGVVTYRCMAEIHNGQQVILPFVQAATSFGGVADYLQIVHKSSMDDSSYEPYSKKDETNNARVGDRVYIAFISGNINKPIIVGYAQHPNQTQEFDDPASIQPQAIFQYNGFRVKVDDAGQVTIMHQGAPKISATSSGGGLGAATSALSSSSNPDLPPDNPAASFPSSDGLTVMEMLNDGVFRIRDADGQVIEIDRTQKRIYITNNDLKSTDDGANGTGAGSPGETDAEFIAIDSDAQSVTVNARKDLVMYSAGDRDDTTEGDYTSEVNGDSTHKIAGDWKITVDGDVTIQSAGTITANGSEGKLVLGSGQVGLGSDSAELVDLFDQTLQQLSQILTAIQALTVIGDLGIPTSPPINIADFISAQAQVEQIDALVQSIMGGV